MTIGRSIGFPPNSAAAPNANPDRDHSNNFTEFLSGFDPTDGDDYLIFGPQNFSGPTTVNLLLNKAIPGRTYTVEKSTDLITFTPGTPFNVPSEENDRIILDPNAADNETFYRLKITR